MQVVFMMLNNFVFLGFWWLFFEKFQSVDGWKIEQVFEVYGLVATSFGMVHFLFGGLPGLAFAIEEGKIDQALSQPKPPLLKLLASRVSSSSFGDMVFGVGLIVGFTEHTWMDIPKILGLAALGASIFLHFSVILQALAFWTGRSSKFSSTIMSSLMTFACYPEELFSGSIRILLFTLIPAGFVAWFPVRLMQNPGLEDLAVYLGICLALGVFAWWFFSRGLRRYESGNQMVVNL